MHLAVYVPLLVPLLAAAAARLLAGRLPPVAATWLLMLTAVALALASSAVLGCSRSRPWSAFPWWSPSGRCQGR
jgi:hypothetical protein